MPCLTLLVRGRHCLVEQGAGKKAQEWDLEQGFLGALAQGNVCLNDDGPFFRLPVQYQELKPSDKSGLGQET